MSIYEDIEKIKADTIKAIMERMQVTIDESKEDLARSLSWQHQYEDINYSKLEELILYHIESYKASNDSPFNLFGKIDKDGNMYMDLMFADSCTHIKNFPVKGIFDDIIIEIPKSDYATEEAQQLAIVNAKIAECENMLADLKSKKEYLEL